MGTLSALMSVLVILVLIDFTDSIGIKCGCSGFGVGVTDIKGNWGLILCVKEIGREIGLCVWVILEVLILVFEMLVLVLVVEILVLEESWY